MAEAGFSQEDVDNAVDASGSAGDYVLQKIKTDLLSNITLLHKRTLKSFQNNLLPFVPQKYIESRQTNTFLNSMINNLINRAKMRPIQEKQLPKPNSGRPRKAKEKEKEKEFIEEEFIDVNVDEVIPPEDKNLRGKIREEQMQQLQILRQQLKPFVTPPVDMSGFAPQEGDNDLFDALNKYKNGGIIGTFRKMKKNLFH